MSSHELSIPAAAPAPGSPSPPAPSSPPPKPENPKDPAKNELAALLGEPGASSWYMRPMVWAAAVAVLLLAGGAWWWYARKAANDVQKQVKGTVNPIKARAENAVREVEGNVGERIGSLLGRFGVPSKSDIEELLGRVSELNRQVKTSTRSRAA